MSDAGGGNGAGRGVRKFLMPSTTRKTNVVSLSSTYSTERKGSGGKGSDHHSGSCAGHQAHCTSQMAGLYDLEETLGKGHFAVVKAAKHVFTGERVAVKVVDKTKLDAMSQKALGQEIVCMKLVQHPHVVRLYEVIETSTKMFLILELGQGDLYDLILKQQGGLSEQLARRYFSQIVSAVSYCHRLHVVHRDLKPENVVYFSTEGGQVKLTDFGFSNKFCPGKKLDTSCGSVAYSAPEILLGDAYDAPAVDIWSLGVILFMLVCGRLPFQEANDSETLTMIMDVKYTVPSHISKSCRDLIDKLLVRYPEKRATLEQVQTHPWLVNDYLDKETVPLITDHRLTQEERSNIIAEMINGGIGTSEVIHEALQKNSYNHVTSTFFLLAEKYLREHGQDKLTHATLTASLESLHERRKSSTAGHSGPSDTENDITSCGSGGEEDSLAPLDLDMRNASAATALAVKKSSGSSSRLHTVLSASSGLGDLGGGDKSLSIVEEASGGASGDEVVQYSDDEGEDSAGPLPTTTNPRRHYHHHRRIIPQRSASSSEDEDSEKMKRRTTSTKTKTNRNHDVCTSAAALQRRRFFDDESSDEQGAGFNNPSGGKIGSSFTSTTTAIMESNCDDTGGGHSTDKTNTNSKGNTQVRDNKEDIEDCQLESVKMNGTHRKSNDADTNSCSSLQLLSVNNSGRPSAPSLGLSKSNGYLSDCNHSLIEVVVSSSCTDDDDELLSPNTKINPGVTNGGTNFSVVDSRQSENLGSGGGAISFVKKGKQFLSWFFLRNKKKHMHHHNSGETNVGGSGASTNGIYKTKSCTELKLRNCSSSSSAAKRGTDVNQNL